jgi:hypothetical protein
LLFTVADTKEFPLQIQGETKSFAIYSSGEDPCTLTLHQLLNKLPWSSIDIILYFCHTGANKIYRRGVVNCA